MNNVWSITTKRWLDIFAYAVLAGVCLLAGLTIGVHPDELVRRVYEWNGLPAVVTIATSLTVAGAFFLLRLGALPRTPRHSFIQYPPTWSAAALFGIVYSATGLVQHSQTWTDVLALCGLSILAVGLVAKVRIRAWSAEGLDRNVEALQSNVVPLSNDTQVDVWRSPEAPLESGSTDVLGTNRVASRLAVALCGDKPCALVGPFGSGKSSIFGAAERLIERSGFLTCKISIWAVAPSDVASRVLEAALTAAKPHYDLTRLLALPAQYREAVRSGSKAFGAFLDVASPTSPKDLLRDFDQMLSLAGDRLIIFIEDLDRNPHESADEAVAALLHMLRPLKRITYSLATDLHSTRVDFIKLFDHVEIIPPLQTDLVVGVLNSLVFELWNRYPNEVHFERSALTESYGSRSSVFDRFSLSRAELPLADALALLVDSPRKLKAVVRNVESAWSDLHGEVSLSELVIEVCLRVTAPQVWQFLVANFVQFYRLPGRDFELSGPAAEKQKAEAAELRKVLHSRFDEAVSGVGLNRSALSTLVEEIVPNWNAPAYALPRVQSLASGDRSRYFRRIFGRSVVEPIRDQEVLAALASLQKEESSDALFNLADRNRRYFAQLVRQFGSTGLSKETLKMLLKQLAQRRYHASAPGLPQLEDDPLFIAAVGVLQSHGEVDVEFVEEFEKTALQNELSSFIEIERKMATGLALHGLKVAEKVRANVDVFAREYLNSAERWLKILPSAVTAENWWHLAGFLRAIHLRDVDYKTSDWSWAAPKLDHAAALSPAVVLPMLAYLLAEVPAHTANGTWNLDEAFLMEWIPDEGLRLELLRTLAHFSAPPELGREASASFERLRVSIAEYLKRAPS